MEAFAAMVDVLDQDIGRLVSFLKEKGLFENTLIMFCSDNGACPFDRTRGKEKSPWDPESYWCYDVGWASVGNTPFRLYKQNQHEGGISSPMIAHLPKSMAAVAEGSDPTRKATPLGAITDQPAHLVDFMATFIELSGAKYPSEVGEREVDPLVGKSLVPILRGEKRVGHDPLYFHFGTDRALRVGDWKIASAKLGQWELFNLAEDRTETNDLAAKHPEKVKKMAGAVDDNREGSGAAEGEAAEAGEGGIHSFEVWEAGGCSEEEVISQSRISISTRRFLLRLASVVLGTRGVVVGDAASLEAFGGNAFVNEVAHEGLGALIAEAEVAFAGAKVAGMSDDFKAGRRKHGEDFLDVT